MLQPPTDNLYKFLAIFGLIVMALSLYTPLQRLETLERNNMQRSIMYKPIIEKAKALDGIARTELECAIHEAGEDIGNDNASVDNPCVRAERAKIGAITAKKDLEVSVEKVTSLEAEHAFLLSQYQLYRTLGVVAGLTGAVLCIAGFWLWYIRLQRYLDIAAREKT